MTLNLHPKKSCCVNGRRSIIGWTDSLSTQLDKKGGTQNCWDRGMEQQPQAPVPIPPPLRGSALGDTLLRWIDARDWSSRSRTADSSLSLTGVTPAIGLPPTRVRKQGTTASQRHSQTCKNANSTEGGIGGTIEQTKRGIDNLVCGVLRFYHAQRKKGTSGIESMNKCSANDGSYATSNRGDV